MKTKQSRRDEIVFKQKSLKLKKEATNPSSSFPPG